MFLCDSHPGSLAAWGKTARALAVVVLTGLWTASGPVAAQPGDITGFQFLRLEPSARAAALAGAYGSIVGDDVNTLFFNPAALNSGMHRKLSVSYLNHIADINAGFAAYSHDVAGIGAFAAGLRYLGYGSMARADENGVRDGTTFGASDAALTIGLSRALGDRLRYGAALSTVFSRIDDVGSSALTADAGVLYRIPGIDLNASLTVHHAGLVLNSLGDTRDELPFDVRVGLSKQLRYLPLLVSVMGYNLTSGAGDAERSALQEALFRLALGGEFRFSEAFQVRFGYNHRRHEELKTKSRLDTAGFSFGFGLRITRFRFDYAYNTWSALGGLNHFTVGTEL